MLILTVIQGPDRGRKFELPDNEPQLIGRSSEALQLSDQTISRRHAELTPDDGRWYVRDLNSANGTYVNNQRVQTGTLSAGDHVIIGPVVFTLQIDGKPADIRPVKTKIHRQKQAVQPEKAATAAKAPAPTPDDELDPISALEALASSADQTAIDLFDEEEK